MDLHKIAHEVCEVSKHWHLPLFAGLISLVEKYEQGLKGKLSDLGDLGDNVPATLIKSLSSRRGL